MGIGIEKETERREMKEQIKAGERRGEFGRTGKGRGEKGGGLK